MLEEIDALDRHHGEGGEAEAVAIGFFSGAQSPEEIQQVSSSAALGIAIVINYKQKGASDWTSSYVYEAITRSPHHRDEHGNEKGLLNNYICRDTEFRRTIRGREFAIKGFYYCQQNHLTHVCAHASLRMTINSIDGTASPLTAAAINSHLGVAAPNAGLNLGQIVQVIKDKTGDEPTITDCTKLPSTKDYISVLASYVESGCITLLVFTTARANEEHVVTVFGHTRNTDEWHPQGIPGYSGPTTAQFYPSSAWIDHFVIHDDNLGPYYTLSSRALEVDPDIKAHWIIAVHPHKMEISPHYAESLGAILLQTPSPQLVNAASGRWFDYIMKTPRFPVMRAILVQREKYQLHLRDSVAHDQSTMLDAEVDLFAGLPEWFWMVEYSVPALFTGNRSKLGEVLIRTDTAGVSQPIDLVLGMRLPGLIVLRGSPSFDSHASGMTSHSKIYVARPHDNEW